MATWGKRCNKIQFFVSENITGYPVVVLGGHDHGKYFLTDKVKKTFYHAYENNLDRYDWFLKVDMDAYVVMENLRGMLHNYSAEHPWVFGQRFHNTRVSEFQMYFIFC